MEYPKIIVRTDASTTIGMGHVMRCIALCSMLRQDFKDIVFMLMKTKPEILHVITKHGFTVMTIENESDFLVTVTGREIVIIDGYHFDPEIYENVKRKGAVTVSIDDLHNKPLKVDVIINPSPNAKEGIYYGLSDIKYLLGTRYALLRPSFIRQAAIKRSIGNVDSVLICFGGSDFQNKTLQTLKVVCKFAEFKRVIAITGAAYLFREELKKFISIQSQDIKNLHNANDDVMVSSLLSVQLAIVPASGILFETVACKTPVVSGFYIDNQQDIYEGFKALNCFYDAADLSAQSVEDALKLALGSDLNKMVENQGRSIDGKSPERYLEVFRGLKDKLIE